MTRLAGAPGSSEAFGALCCRGAPGNDCDQWPPWRSGGPDVSRVAGEAATSTEPTSCVFVHEGVRNSSDPGILLSNFDQNVPVNTLGDCNGDGVVTTIDRGTMAAHFGQPC